MLKQRLLTAAILMPLVIASILYLPTALTRLMLIIVVLLAAIEWFKIIGYNRKIQLIFAISILAFAMLIGLMLSASTMAIIVFVLWGVILFVVCMFANKAISKGFLLLILQPLPALVIASAVLTLFALTSVQLHESGDTGPQYLLYVVVLVSLADSGGYFVGKRWGKTPLAVAISPNKTWEGAFGGLLLALAWAVFAYALDMAMLLTWQSWLILSFITVLIAMTGDLFESLFKRYYRVKDSGTLLPGHGGLLDRIDGLIAAVPIFTSGLFLLGV